MLHFSSNQQIRSYMQAARLDASPCTVMPTNVLNEVKKAGSTEVNVPSLVAASLAIGWWLITLGPSAYNTFIRLYGTYDGYVPAGAKLDRYPTGNSTADNFLDTPDTVNVSGLGSVIPGQVTYQFTSLDLNQASGLAQRKAITAKLITATDYELPAIQLWDYINVQFVDDKRFGDWPTGNDTQLNLRLGCG